MGSSGGLALGKFNMALPVMAFFTALGGAGAASADVRYYAYDAADRVTQSLTRGVTFEVERGLAGATRLRGLYSTSSRGTARFVAGGPSQVRSVLPQGADQTRIYVVERKGDGAALARALCPGSEETWLVSGRIRTGEPLDIQVVGRWPDGAYRHCVKLAYRYRGEWAQPPGNGVTMPD